MCTKVAGCQITEQTVIHAQLKEVSLTVIQFEPLIHTCSHWQLSVPKWKTHLYTLIKMVVLLEQLLAIDLVSCPGPTLS